jgi:hypothetical protein
MQLGLTTSSRTGLPFSAVHVVAAPTVTSFPIPAFITSKFGALGYLPGVSPQTLQTLINNGTLESSNLPGLLSPAQITQNVANNAPIAYTGQVSAGVIAYNGVPLAQYGLGPEDVGTTILGSGYSNPGLSVNAQPISIAQQNNAYSALASTFGDNTLSTILLAVAGIVVGAATGGITGLLGLTSVPGFQSSLTEGDVFSGNSTNIPGFQSSLTEGGDTPTPSLPQAPPISPGGPIGATGPAVFQSGLTEGDVPTSLPQAPPISPGGPLDTLQSSLSSVGSAASSLLPGAPSLSSILSAGTAIAGAIDGSSATGRPVNAGVSAAQTTAPIGLGGDTSSLIGWGVLIGAMVLIINGSNRRR